MRNDSALQFRILYVGKIPHFAFRILYIPSQTQSKTWLIKKRGMTKQKQPAKMIKWSSLNSSQTYWIEWDNPIEEYRSEYE